MKKIAIIIILLGIGGSILAYTYYNNSNNKVAQNTHPQDTTASNNNQLHNKVTQNTYPQDTSTGNNDQLHNKVTQNNNPENTNSNNNQANNKTTIENNTNNNQVNNTNNPNNNCPYSLQDFYGKWTAIKAVGAEGSSLGYTLSDINKTMIIKENSLEVNGQTFNCKEILEPFNLRKFEDPTHSTPKAWGLPKIDYILNNKYQNTLYIVDSNHLITNIGGVIFEFAKQ